jgi:hypothetical protein
MSSYSERLEIIKQIKAWTRKIPGPNISPSLTWDEISSYHQGTSAMNTVDKYLDEVHKLVIMYAAAPSTHRKYYKLNITRFWKKNVKRHVFVSYCKEKGIWATCDCTRK